ncbi:CRTAC1 family protein [Planctomicrobium sp.]|nr:CRTAC1 family protein [Planctomicrobium sp.]MDB4743646.1 CRTAC1 family protein [Planctomicrobium sp.]
MKPAFRMITIFLVLTCGVACRREPNESEQAVTTTHSSVTSQPIEEYVMFQDVADEWGIQFSNTVVNPENYSLVAITGSGCAILDVNQDGLLDVLFAGFDLPDAPSNRLFCQINEGVFKDLTEEFGLANAPASMGVAVGDCNNDGWPDLYLPSHQTDTLWLNNSGKSFTDITSAAGLENIRWGAAASWVDYNRDGWLDLYVANYVDYQHRPCIRLGGGDNDFCGPKLFQGTSDRLFKNVTADHNGVPTFEDVTQACGIGKSPGRGLGVLAADFTTDGWIDFYVANDQEPNQLWVNQQNGTFEDEAVLRGCAVGVTGKPQASMGLAFTDIDGNGHEDLMISHLSQEPHALYVGWSGGLYREESQSTGLADATTPFTGFGIAVEDFNHNGQMEVITANGRVNRSQSMNSNEPTANFWSAYSQKVQVLRELNNSQFVPTQAFVTQIPPTISRGLAVGDLDGDGDADVIVSNTASQSFVFQNIAEKQGEWLKLRLLDPAHHGRTAYGARLTIIFSDQSETVRTFQPCASFSSTHSPALHLGCQKDIPIEMIDIVWPDGSMEPERFHIEELNTQIELVRGQGTLEKE